MEISDAKDGSMHIKLHQPTGIKEITVTETKGKEIIELNRIEYNDNHRETRRHVSLEAYDPYGALVKDDADPLQEVINKEEMDQLPAIFSKYSYNQKAPFRIFVKFRMELLIQRLFVTTPYLF